MGIKASDVVNLAVSCIGIDKRKVIDTYNAHKPLAVGHVMSYTEPWCDAFLSYLYIVLNAVDLIGGTECGVERHIQLFKKKGIWDEDGTIAPKPGYIICYNWDDDTQPNDGFADHIGVVEKVEGGIITTVEGNTGGGGGVVGRCKVKVGDGNIRGYAKPNYETESKNSPGGNFGKTISNATFKMDLTKPIVDVSEWQGEIDWEKAKSQIGGAIIRVAYSTNKVDDFVARNLDECEHLGIPYGIYIYSLAFSESLARTEAAKALELIKGRKLTLPVYIDIEENSYGYIAKTVAKAFCNAVKDAGYKYGVYTGEYYYRNFLSGIDIPGCSWWIARYGTNDGTKQLNNKPKLAMDGWQYTSVGIIDGIKGNVDLSEFYTDFSGGTSTGVKEPVKTETKKTVDELANEVIAGKWGNGDDRVKRLTSAGYDAAKVQAKVNEIFGSKKPETKEYTVRCGDTLSSIAEKFGTTYLKIAADNHITNPNLIYPGQKLIIR